MDAFTFLVTLVATLLIVLIGIFAYLCSDEINIIHILLMVIVVVASISIVTIHAIDTIPYGHKYTGINIGKDTISIIYVDGIPIDTLSLNQSK